MFNFARCLEGGLGVPKNEIQAQEWYRKAAEAGEARAANWCKTHKVPFTQG
jgi:TPR repeat protein